MQKPILLQKQWTSKTLEPTATARLARVGLGFEFASVAFGLALPVAVAQFHRSATREHLPNGAVK